MMIKTTDTEESNPFLHANHLLYKNAERNLTEKSEGSRNSTRKRAHNAQSEEKKPQPHKRLKTHSEYNDSKMPKGRVVGYQLAYIAQQLWEARVREQESALFYFDLIKESGKKKHKQSLADIMELQKAIEKRRRFGITRYFSGPLRPLNLLALPETQGAMGIFLGPSGCYCFFSCRTLTTCCFLPKV